MILERNHCAVKMNRRVNLEDLNPHLMCVLCGGYYVDATTIIECLHSFCRSCIVKHLESSKYCPICEVMVHKTKPLINIRRDKTLQDIVYKLVPGLYTNEMKNRRQFYKERPHYVKPDDVESGGDVSDDPVLSLSGESYTVALTYHDEPSEKPRYMQCPVGVSIRHLQKLILAKFGLNSVDNAVEVFLKGQPLHGDLSLLDISCLYLWRTKDPLELTYLIFERGVRKRAPVQDTGSVKEGGIKDRDDPVKTEEPVEKEVQLQITETGVMKICEIDSRQVYSDLVHLDSDKAYLVPPPQCLVFENHVPHVVASVPEESSVNSRLISAPVEMERVSNRKEVFSKCKKVESKKTGRKRLSVEQENGMVTAKRLSVDTVKTDVKEERKEGDKQTEVVASIVNNVEEKIRPPENQSAGMEVPKMGASCAVTENVLPNDERREEGGKVEKRLEPGGPERGLEPGGVERRPESGGQERSSEDNGKEGGKYDKRRQEVKVVVPTSSQEGECPQILMPQLPVGRPPHESPKPVRTHKPIRSAPQIWHPVITKEKLRPTLMKSSDEPHKPSKIFKMRSMPRYLGNPASGVKPMYGNGLPPAAPPVPITPPRVRVDQKPPTPRPTTPKLQEEKKASYTLLTSPFIPRDNHFLLPDPKTSHPLSPTKIPFPPAFHKSLPPCITHYMATQHQPVRNIRVKDETANNCDSTEPSASSSNKEKEQAPVAVETHPEPPTKCSS